MNLNRTLFLLAVLLGLPWGELAAQNTQCFGFGELMAGSIYGEAQGDEPGDVLLEQDGAVASLELFYYLNEPDPAFNYLEVGEQFFSNFQEAEGLHLFVSNIALHFDYEGLPAPVNAVSFAFFDGGGSENFSVNGSDVFIVETLDQLPAQVGDVEITVTYTDPNGAFINAGIVTLTGPVQSFSIGGQEFALDNVCAEYGQAACSISDLNLEYLLQTPDGHKVLVDFNYVGVLGDQFSLKVDGELIGLFSYNDLPLEVVLPCTNNLVSSVVVCDVNDQVNCCAEIDYQFPLCNDPCNIEDLSAELINSNADGATFVVNFSGGAAPPAPNGFAVYFNGELIGNYAQGEVPVTLFIPCNLLDPNANGGELKICLDNSLSCCETIYIELPDCNNTGCELWDLVIEPQDCTPNGVFFVDLDFNYNNVGNDGFQVVGNGNNYGTFSYDDLPVTLGPLVGDGTTPYEFIVKDINHPDCQIAGGIDPVDCGVGTCNIFDLTAELISDNADGAFYQINFEYVGVGNLGFDVFFNNQSLGFFSYSELPLEIFIPCNLINNDGGGQLLICDNDSNCCEDIYLNLPDCNNTGCELWDLVIEPQDCTPNGVFFVDLDFNYNNVGNDGFQVVGNGNNYGTFSYDDLPVTLGPLVGDGTTPYEFIVKDINHPDCQIAGGIDPVDCGVGTCNIFDLTAELISDNADGAFYQINFEYVGVGNLGFDVFFNNQSLGFFSYSELPLEIFIPCNLINNDGGGQLLICDNDSNCCEDIYLNLPDCNNTGCELWDLVIEPQDCTPNGIFFVDLDFNYNNVGNDGFQVVGNGNNYGTFSYDDLPVTLGPLVGDGTTPYEFIVKDINHPDCQIAGGIDPVDCIGGVCEIYDLTTELISASQDGAFYLIDFEYANVDGLGFDVHFNDEFIGFYSYDDLPVEVFIPCDLANNNQGGVMWVCENDDMSCCADTYLALPECEGDCAINDLVAHFINSSADGAFFLLDFDAANPSNAGYDVYFNGEFIGFYPYSNLPQEVFIPCSLTNDGEGGITVCDHLSPNCCASVFVEIPDCEGDCLMENLVIEPYGCNNSGFFFVDLDFEQEYGSEDGFYLAINGVILGVYDYDELPLTVGPLLGNGLFDYEFILFDAEDSNCHLQGTLEAIDCSDACDIQEIAVDVLEVTPNGYQLFLNFTYLNVAGDLFSVYFEDEFIGNFPYSALPLEFEVPCISNNLLGTLTICDQSPNTVACCESVTIELPPCTGNCVLFDMTAEALPCEDGQFFVEIDLQYLNSGNTFKIIGNGNNYGIFEYSDLPILLGPFEGNGQMVYEFIAIDEEHPNCSTFVEYGPVACDDDCGVNDLSAEFLEITPNGLLYLLEFAADPSINMGYDVYFNNEFIGFYLPGDVPIEVVIPCQNLVEGVFSVCLNDQPDCCTEVEVAVPSCNDCQIFDLQVGVGECNSNTGSYLLEIDFEYVNPGNDFFDVFINGQLFESYLLSQLPLVIEEFPGTNVLLNELTICINDVPNCCLTATFESPDCSDSDGDVWPGDANNDNVAHHFDLLNIGLAYGSEGPQRANIGNAWLGFEADDWSPSFVTDDLNFKFADCNGDGAVNSADLEAIALNYNQTHGPVSPFLPIEGGAGDPPLFVDLPDGDQLELGQGFEAPVVLGTADIPVENIYGLAFTLAYDPTIVQANSVQVSFPASWLGVNEVNLLTWAQPFPGRIEVAMVRNDQNDVFGHGTIMKFIGIIDDVLGKEELMIEVLEVRAITSGEELIPLHRPVEIIDLTTSTQDLLSEQIALFPNPSHDLVWITAPADLEISTLQIRDMAGRLIKTVEQPAGSFSMSGLPAGVYLLQLQTSQGLVYKRISKI